MGAAFTPYLPHTGAVGGIFGELAALMLELMQSWKLVRHPWLELLKMLGIIGVFLFMGESLSIPSMFHPGPELFWPHSGNVHIPAVSKQLLCRGVIQINIVTGWG